MRSGQSREARLTGFEKARLTGLKRLGLQVSKRLGYRLEKAGLTGFECRRRLSLEGRGAARRRGLEARSRPRSPTIADPTSIASIVRTLTVAARRRGLEARSRPLNRSPSP